MFDNKKGQVTLFIILGIIIVVVVLSIFFFRGKVSSPKISPNIEPIQANFLNCIERGTLAGISILESKGGYIENPLFVPGSTYMPFSSELDFLGVQIPYWYYISGNNLEYEQIPSLQDMEKQLENYLEQKLINCNFEEYKNQGYSIENENLEVDVSIDDESVFVEVNSDLNVGFENEIYLMEDFSVEVDSFLGTLYEDAKKIYELEMENYFLENYSLDVLYLYAPVTGVELGCSPLFWNVDEFYGNLSEAIVGNIGALKNKGREDDYFALNLPIDSEINLITSSSWPTTFEVTNSDNNILVAKPIGNQEGLGILGFCYVPYHFVYNWRFPVLIQVSRFDEVFQFPLPIIIDRNMPKEGKKGNSYAEEVSNICEYKNNEMVISVYDSELNPIDANVSYQCFGVNCYIGKTNEGKLKEFFPQCVNGVVKVSSDGFKDSYVKTDINQTEVVFILDREYELDLEIISQEGFYSGNAIINFIGEDSTFSLAYPEQKKVTLSEGKYEIEVYLYSESSLIFEETTTEYCVDVPSSGIKGYFGFEEKECVESIIPEQEIENILIGGGKIEYYFLEKNLKNSQAIVLNAKKFNLPDSIEELSLNYELVEKQSLEVSFE
jgi:hypothetical protein